MNRWNPLRIVIGVIAAGFLFAAMFSKWSSMMMNMLTLALALSLLSSVVLWGIQRLVYRPEQAIRMNIRYILLSYSLFLLSFFSFSTILNQPAADAFKMTLLILLIGSAYGLSSWDKIFKKGWNSFFVVMIIPVFLIMWLTMFGLTAGGNLTNSMLYNFLLFSGIIYWVIIGSVMWIFKDRILKKSEEQMS